MTAYISAEMVPELTEQVNQYWKGKTNLDILEQEMVNGSGIAHLISLKTINIVSYNKFSKPCSGRDGFWPNH